MPRQAMDYSKTIIYKIVCNDLNINETYVGHTTSFVKRKASHKSICNNEKSKHYEEKKYQTIRANGGWDNWSMIQILEFPCSSLQEALAEERRHYELLNSNLNTHYPCRSKKEWYEANPDYMKEYNKEYREANIDKIKTKTKEYRDANKEKKAEYDKEYRDANKDKIVERYKIKYTCCCGSILLKQFKNRHEKSQKHKKFSFSQNLL